MSHPKSTTLLNRQSFIINGEWLPDMDLNHDKQIQSLLCYRYTIGQTSGSKVDFPERESRFEQGATGVGRTGTPRLRGRKLSLSERRAAVGTMLPPGGGVPCGWLHNFTE